VLAGLKTEEIVTDENLPVALGPRADPDRWDRELFGYSGAKVLRNALNHNTEGSGVLKCLSVSNYLLSGTRADCLCRSLNFKSAHSVEGLRCHADVAHDWDVEVNQPFDGVSDRLTTLNLNRGGSALFY
jgi:hypothetical protein